jgi:DNA (cytosine-5)-methyltransferase 1
MSLRVADLFAGIGGATLAFRRAGYRPVFASEISPTAADTYAANHGHRPEGDIAGIDPARVPDHDVCFVGLPCAGFSCLGWRLGFDDAREAVWYSALKLVAHKRSRVVVVENVRGLVHNDDGRSLRFLLGTLRAAGYRASWRVLDATQFGGAQVRQRLFVVASRGRRFDFDGLGTKPAGCIRDVLAPDPEDQYLEPTAYRLLDEPHRCRSGPVFAGYLLGRPLWNPGGRFDLPRTHGHLSRVYCQGGPSPTLTAQGSGRRLWVLTDEGVRRLNRQEWTKLMSFPADFAWPRPGVARDLLGNSVHVPTVEALARAIREQLF